MPSRRQHKENERDCRTIVQQLVSSIPHEVLTSTSYGRKEQENEKQKKTVTFVDQDKEGEKVERRRASEFKINTRDKEVWGVPDKTFSPSLSAPELPRVCQLLPGIHKRICGQGVSDAEADAQQGEKVRMER